MSLERRRNHTARAQFPMLMRLVAVWGTVALVVAVARLQGDSAIASMSPVPEGPWYDGAIADVNLVIWGVSAAIAYFGGWIAFQTHRPSAGRFLTAGGAVTSWLLADHMLLIHADVLPDAGVPLMLAAVLALLPVMVWIVYFRNEVRRTRSLLLGCATLAHQIAIVFGGYWSLAEQTTVVSEETTLLAASVWCLYVTLTTRDIARSTVHAALERRLEADAAPESEPEPAPVPG